METGLDRFGAYQKALELFDLVVKDMDLLRDRPECRRLISQQIASADSIPANIEEGFGRLSRLEYIRFLNFARGSARETQGRYRRMRHWLPAELVEDRTRRAGEIIAILTRTIQTLRQNPSKPPATSVREDSEPYGVTEEASPPSPFDPQHLPLETRASSPLPPDTRPLTLDP